MNPGFLRGGDEKEKASPGGDDDDEARVRYQRRVHRRD